MFCSATVWRSVFCVILAFFVSYVRIVAQADGLGDHKQNESSYSSKRDEVFRIRNFDALLLDKHKEKIKSLGKGEAGRSSLNKGRGDSQDKVSYNRRPFFGQGFSVKKHINGMLGQCGREYDYLNDDMSSVVLCVFNKVPESIVMLKNVFDKGFVQLKTHVRTKLDQYDKKFEDLNKNYPDSFNQVPDMIQNIKKGVGGYFENLKNSFQKRVYTAASDDDVKEELPLENAAIDSNSIDAIGCSTKGSSIHVDSAYNSPKNSSHVRPLLSENKNKTHRFFYFGWPSLVLRGGRFYVALKKMTLVCAGVGVCGRLFLKLYEKYGSSLQDYFDFYYHDLFNRDALNQNNDAFEEEVDV